MVSSAARRCNFASSSFGGCPAHPAASVQLHCSSLPIHSLTRGEIGSWRWQRSSSCRRSTNFAIMWSRSFQNSRMPRLGSSPLTVGYFNVSANGVHPRSHAAGQRWRGDKMTRCAPSLRVLATMRGIGRIRRSWCGEGESVTHLKAALLASMRPEQSHVPTFALRGPRVVH